MFFLVQQYGRTYKHWAARHLTLPVPLAEGILSDSVCSVRGYFVGSAIVGLENAVVLGLAALFLGTPVPFVIAVVAFLFSFVPFIGAVVTGVFAVLMALAGGGPTDALIMLIFVILANGVLQTVVQQIALGSTLNLNPLIVLVASVIGSIIAGPVGGMIACPLTAVAVMAAGRIRQEELMGSGPAEGLPIEPGAGEGSGNETRGSSRPAEETPSG